MIKGKPVRRLRDKDARNIADQVAGFYKGINQENVNIQRREMLANLWRVRSHISYAMVHANALASDDYEILTDDLERVGALVDAKIRKLKSKNGK